MCLCVAPHSRIRTSIRGKANLGREPTSSAPSCPQKIQVTIAKRISRQPHRTEQKYQQAFIEYKDGARFVMWNVGFAEDAKLAYVSFPIKMVVVLSKTKMDLCIGASDSAVQPAPTATVAGSISIGTNQFFDVTALIQEVQETSQHEKHIFFCCKDL